MQNNLFLDDMLAEVSSFSYERKMAIAFAVYTNATLTDIVNLKWDDEVEMNWRAEFIFKNLQISNSIDNVFWERVDGKDAPMVSLPFMFSVATVWRDWRFFVKQHKLATPISLSAFL